jgi:Subtilase family
MQSAHRQTGNRGRARGAGARLCATLVLLAAAGGSAQTAAGAQAAAGARATPGAQAAAGAVSPLPRSDYRVSDVCATPGPRHVSCLAQELVPETAAARARLHPIGMTRSRPLAEGTPAEGAYGLRPEDLKGAYFFEEPAENAESETQTIALVDAYNDLYAEADLKTYGEAFEPTLPTLAPCGGEVTKSCFEKVNQEGKAGASTLPFPRNATELDTTVERCEVKHEATYCALEEEALGWSVETSLDIEIAHAVCRNCRIVLVEANSPEDTNLEAAENTAAKPIAEGGLGATEISNSWGGEEPPTDSVAFKHPGIVITAAAGDSGYLNWTEAEAAHYVGAEYPASSPHVVAVGGTRLKLGEETEAWEGETAWNDGKEYGAGGSGCSASFKAQPWQSSLPDWSAVGCASERAVADVSADADPYTGVAVYDSEVYCESSSSWCTLGGTSLSSPLIAAMFALAGGAHEVAYPAQTLYEHLETSLLHTVSGSNAECQGEYSSGCTGSMNTLSSRFAFDCGEGILICNSAAGCEGHYYAGPAGVGTPNGIGALDPEEHPERDAKACEGAGGERGESSGGTTSLAEASAPATAIALTPTGSGSTAPPPSTTAIAPIPVISNLMLTRIARVALRRSHARTAAWRVAFAFTVNVATRVRVRLARRRVVHGHVHWRKLRGRLTIEAMPGRNSAHLRARRRLAHGLYRLTAIPSAGSAGVLTFRVG